MLTPVLVQRGSSVEKFKWNKIHEQRHEEYGMIVFSRFVEEYEGKDTYAEVYAELSVMGIPLIRANFAYSDSTKPIVGTHIRAFLMPDALLFLVEAFRSEYITKGSALLTNARMLGTPFMTPEDMEDVRSWTEAQMKKFNIQQQHYRNELMGDYTTPAQFSAFLDVIETLDAPFEAKEIDGE